MRFLVLSFISMILMAPACQDQANTALRRSEVARSWLKQKPDSVQRWAHHMTYDPYDNGHFYYGDAKNPEVLELATDGKFHAYDSAQQSFGIWFINPSDSSFFLQYEVRNDRLITKENFAESQRHQYVLRKMSKDTLILETQGRHGMLVLTYLPLRDSLSQ